MAAQRGMDRHSGPENGLVKPRIDQQEYRLITLPNGLRALLVSDFEADKAAAACDVSSALQGRGWGPGWPG